MIILYILLSLLALIAICIMGVMFFDMSGKTLACLYEWFLRKF